MNPLIEMTLALRYPRPNRVIIIGSPDMLFKKQAGKVRSVDAVSPFIFLFPSPYGLLVRDATEGGCRSGRLLSPFSEVRSMTTFCLLCLSFACLILSAPRFYVLPLLEAGRSNCAHHHAVAIRHFLVVDKLQVGSSLFHDLLLYLGLTGSIAYVMPLVATWLANKVCRRSKRVSLWLESSGTETVKCLNILPILSFCI